MTALAFDRQRRLLGEVDALDFHKQGRQTSIESTKQLRSVVGGVEGIEERVLISRTETLRCEIHRPLRGSRTCGIPWCSSVDVYRSARSKREMRCKSIVKATRAVVTRTFKLHRQNVSKHEVMRVLFLCFNVSVWDRNV